MLTGQITAAVLGIGLTAAILFLVRRDHMHGPYALWWFAVPAAPFVLRVFPHEGVWLGDLTGILYAPLLPIIVGRSQVLIRLLTLDVYRSRQERRLRRLTQKLAILEQEIERLGGRPPMVDDEDDGEA
jgi:hypothetical protein